MAYKLLRRIRLLTWLFIVGLILSGVTAIPLQTEVNLLVKFAGVQKSSPSWGKWLLKAQDGLNATAGKYPFLYYGTDWLAFGHFMIAIAFIGALSDPVRNRWLFTFGMIACVSVVPYAMIFGAFRGIPFWWRCIDCSFGLLGIVPLLYCRKWSAILELLEPGSSRKEGSDSLKATAVS